MQLRGTRIVGRGARPSSGGFTMPASASFTIDALHLSWDEVANYSEPAFTTATNYLPSGLGAVTASGPSAGSVTYSLPETEATNRQVLGWGIDSSTGQLKLVNDALMRFVGNGPTRTFKVRGSYGGTDQDTTVTITLDTSGADLDIAGIDYAIGAGVLRAWPTTVPTVPSTPATGWTAYNSGGQNWIETTTNSPAVLKDFDLRGFSLVLKHNNATVENCIFDDGKYAAPPFQVTTIEMQAGTTNNTVRYCTADCNGRTHPWKTNFLVMNSVGGLFEYNSVYDASNDVADVGAGTLRYNYLNTFSMNTRKNDGVTYLNYDTVMTGSVNSVGNVPSNGTLIINGQTVNLLSGDTPASVVTKINTAAVPFVTASIGGSGQLVLTLNTTFTADGDPVTAAFTVSGTLSTHFGLPTSQNIWLQSSWGHSDVIQCFNTLGPISILNNFCDSRYLGRHPQTNQVATGRTACLFMEGPLDGVQTLIGDIDVIDNYGLGATFFLQGAKGSEPCPGTISLSSGSATVTGTGTNFTTLFGGTGAPVTTLFKDKFWIQTGSGAGMEFTVTNVASDTSLTLSAVAGITDASAKMFKVWDNNLSYKVTGITKYKNNRFGGRSNLGEYYTYPRWQSSYQDNKYGWTATYAGGAKTKGDALGPTINPEITAISATIIGQTSTSVTFSFTEQTDTRVYVRHRTTSGPGAWSAYTLLDLGTKKYEPGSLSASTQYDFELYAENWNTSFSTIYSAKYSGVYGSVLYNGSATKRIADGPTSQVTGTTSAPAAPTYVLLTAGAGTWTVPAGVTTIDVFGIGAGGGGGGGSSSFGGLGGRSGGGGAYAEVLSLSVTPGQTTYYNAPAGPAGNAAGSFQATSAATNTWFNKTSNAVPASTTDGIRANSAVEDAGGTTATSVGSTKYAGGNGQSNFGKGGRGGGGAAGPSGAGKNGGSSAGDYAGDGGGGANGGSSTAGGTVTSPSVSGVGGAGNSGSGGGAATSSLDQAGNNGSSGGGGSGGANRGSVAGGVGGKGGMESVWSITAGGTAGPAGGSGGGGCGDGTGNAGVGGSATLGYGGGGGGGGYGLAGSGVDAAGGDGGAGCIVIKYT
jgi:hypothetical protein